MSACDVINSTIMTKKELIDIMMKGKTINELSAEEKREYRRLKNEIRYLNQRVMKTDLLFVEDLSQITDRITYREWFAGCMNVDDFETHAVSCDEKLQELQRRFLRALLSKRELESLIEYENGETIQVIADSVDLVRSSIQSFIERGRKKIETRPLEEWIYRAVKKRGMELSEIQLISGIRKKDLNNMVMEWERRLKAKKDATVSANTVTLERTLSVS